MSNNLEIFNRRMTLKRSSISSEVPTIPSGSTAVDVLDHTQGGWLVTDLYDGELFLNTSDDRIWGRFGDEIVEIASTSGTSSFLELSDTPGSYSASTILAVNAAGNAVEFITNTIATTITNLTDTPSGITDDMILVGESGVYVEKDYIYSFEQLTGGTTFSGNGMELIRINGAETSLESVEGSSLFVDLINNQTIEGNKTFCDDVNLSGTTTFTNLYDTEGNYFDEIITDTGLTFASNTNIGSTLAVKTYIDNKVITAVSGDYVPISGDMTILDTKTFSGATIFSDDVTISGDINSMDIYQDISTYHYYGSLNVDGSYRTFINPLGLLETQKRNSGVWEFEAQI